MRIPVTLYRLAYGTGLGDPAPLEHGVFTNEAAATRVYDAAAAEVAKGHCLVSPGKTLYVEAFAGEVEADDPLAAQAAGFLVDLTRLIPAPTPDAPIIDAPREDTPA